MSAKLKVRLLVICSSSGEGVFVYLKKKDDGTRSLTYSEELKSRPEGEAWIKGKMREVFGPREADRLMERNDTFFDIDQGSNPNELNYAVVVAHGQIPNAICACKKKEPHLLSIVARDARVAEDGVHYDGFEIRLSAPARTVIRKIAEKYLPRKVEKLLPVTVST